MDLFDDEPSERAVRAVNRYAVRKAFGRETASRYFTAATTAKFHSWTFQMLEA